eukprot:951517-Prymnesium_polylepis.1
MSRTRPPPRRIHRSARGRSSTAHRTISSGAASRPSRAASPPSCRPEGVAERLRTASRRYAGVARAYVRCGRGARRGAGACWPWPPRGGE